MATEITSIDDEVVVMPEVSGQVYGGRILVIDDHLEQRDLCTRFLALRRFEVRTAGCGPSALAVLEVWRPDAILLDLDMVKTDARALLRHLHGISALDGIPVLGLSIERGLARMAKDLGAAAVLSKPCDLCSLLEMLERVA